MVGCVQQNVIYAHTDKADYLTKESRGDNISDFNDLQGKAETLCSNQGHKEGIVVIGSWPGQPVNQNGIASYTLAYQCKDPSVTDQLASAYGKVKKQFGN